MLATLLFWLIVVPVFFAFLLGFIVSSVSGESTQKE
jgi:cytochrome b561